MTSEWDLQQKEQVGGIKIDEPLNFWRSVNKQEVDFVIGGRIAIEVKSKNRVTKKDNVKLLLWYFGSHDGR